MSVISKSRNGEVVLFYRGDSPRVFCRLKRPEGGWIQRSTKQTDKAAAQLQAEKWLDEIKILASHGLPVETRTFASVCRLYLRELEREIELDLRNPRHLKDYKPTVERYLQPFFGRKQIGQITNRDIAEYQKWRVAYWITGPGAKREMITYERGGKTIRRPRPKGKPPSRTTQNSELVVLRGIFRLAVREDLIKEAQVPSVTMQKQRKREDNRRAAFSREEYDQLAQFLFEWARDKKAKNRERRWLLRNYVLVLAHSGIRPGSETDNLCWKHVKEAKTKDGQSRFVLQVNGKTGERRPVVSGPGYSALNQIRIDHVAKRKKVDGNQSVFALPDGTPLPNDYLRQLFRTALQKAGLLFDENGAQRSLYSLRHTYATFQLLYSKVNIYTLAKQMGTSVRMIEQHYGHLTPELAIDELTGNSVDDFI